MGTFRLDADLRLYDGGRVVSGALLTITPDTALPGGGPQAVAVRADRHGVLSVTLPAANTIARSFAYVVGRRATGQTWRVPAQLAGAVVDLGTFPQGGRPIPPPRPPVPPPDPTPDPTPTPTPTPTTGGLVAPALPALTALSGHRVVTPTDDGLALRYADRSRLGDLTRPVFLTLGAVAAGVVPQLAALGRVVEPSWGWPPGARLFLGTDGLVVATPPTQGVLRVLASAIDATTIWLDPQPSLVLTAS